MKVIGAGPPLGVDGYYNLFPLFVCIFLWCRGLVVVSMLKNCSLQELQYETPRSESLLILLLLAVSCICIVEEVGLVEKI